MVQTAVHGHLWAAVFLSLEILNFTIICVILYLYIFTKEVISMLLSGKTVVLGVSGSIAAYKIPTLVRLLKKQGAMFRYS